MITRITAVRQVPDWQTELARAITSPEELLRILDLDASLLDQAKLAAKTFHLRAPRGYVARMQKGNADDPLLRQVLPLGLELQAAQGFVRDPVADGAAMVAPGVLHKYHGRILLTTTGACAVHCRYCFRRHFPYSAANPAAGDWKETVDYITSDGSIHEVILSGGDPLTLSDRRLASLTQRLDDLPQLKRLRIHTRLPVVLPERVVPEMLSWLRSSRLQVVVVVHANHAQEINDQVKQSLQLLSKAGATLLNQAVILRGVNDELSAQVELCEALFDAGVLPYYLHLLDPVAGAAHFNVPEQQASILMRELMAVLPGYLVPRLVREEPGAHGKSPIPW
jgi:EF-P beta-lysylation protein EpmB